MNFKTMTLLADGQAFNPTVVAGTGTATTF